MSIQSIHTHIHILYIYILIGGHTRFIPPYHHYIHIISPIIALLNHHLAGGFKPRGIIIKMMVGIIIRNKVEQKYNHQPDHHWHCCPLYPWLKWLNLHECCLNSMTNHIVILPSLLVLNGFMVKMATGLSPWEWTNKITSGHNQSQPSGSLRRLPSSVAAAPS